MSLKVYDEFKMEMERHLHLHLELIIDFRPNVRRGDQGQFLPEDQGAVPRVLEEWEPTAESTQSATGKSLIVTIPPVLAPLFLNIFLGCGTLDDLHICFWSCCNVRVVVCLLYVAAYILDVILIRRTTVPTTHRAFTSIWKTSPNYCPSHERERWESQLGGDKERGE
jgi:hypothetical protein